MVFFFLGFSCETSRGSSFESIASDRGSNTIRRICQCGPEKFAMPMWRINPWTGWNTMDECLQQENYSSCKGSRRRTDKNNRCFFDCKVLCCHRFSGKPQISALSSSSHFSNLLRIDSTCWLMGVDGCITRQFSSSVGKCRSHENPVGSSHQDGPTRRFANLPTRHRPPEGNSSKILDANSVPQLERHKNGFVSKTIFEPGWWGAIACLDDPQSYQMVSMWAAHWKWPTRLRV